MKKVLLQFLLLLLPCILFSGGLKLGLKVKHESGGDGCHENEISGSFTNLNLISEPLYFVGTFEGEVFQVSQEINNYIKRTSFERCDSKLTKIFHFSFLVSKEMMLVGSNPCDGKVGSFYEYQICLASKDGDNYSLISFSDDIGTKLSACEDLVANFCVDVIGCCETPGIDGDSFQVNNQVSVNFIDAKSGEKYITDFKVKPEEIREIVILDIYGNPLFYLDYFKNSSLENIMLI